MLNHLRFHVYQIRSNFFIQIYPYIHIYVSRTITNLPTNILCTIKIGVKYRSNSWNWNFAILISFELDKATRGAKIGIANHFPFNRSCSSKVAIGKRHNRVISRV